MSLRVWKFGGSSLQDLPSIERVALRIRAAYEQGDKLVVVCSAMGRATDDLVKLAHDTAPQAHGRELDMLVTAGERIAASLLSLRLGHIGVPAWSLTGSQSGIVTDNAHGNARILAIRPHRVLAGLEAARVVVVAGFQGVSEQGDVTSLARGGSDTTAIALAAALGADVCEIYSDVDGVYSADPRKVDDAGHLSAIDIDSMQALADGGAKVLAAEAVALAKRAGIRIETGHAHRPGKKTDVTGTWQPTMGQMAAVASCPVCVYAQTPEKLRQSADDAVLFASPSCVVVRRAAHAAGDDTEHALVTVVGRPAAASVARVVQEAFASLPDAQWLMTDANKAMFLVARKDEQRAVHLAHACITRLQARAGRPSVSLSS